MKRALMLGLLVVGGCRTVSSVHEDPQEGTVTFYEGLSRQKALEITKWVMKDKGADKLRVTDEWVVGEWYTNVVSWGAYCGVFPEETKEGCRVRVVSKRKAALSVFTGITEGGFVSAFEARLNGSSLR